MNLDYILDPPKNTVDELKMLLKQLLIVRTGEDPKRWKDLTYPLGYTEGRELGAGFVFHRLRDLIGEDEAVKVYSEYEKAGSWDWSKE